MIMTFDKLWKLVPNLSNTEKRQVPKALKQDTKKRLELYSPFEVGAIVRAAIDEIEHGSVETVDVLVRKRL